MEDVKEIVMKANWILLGALMLIPGILKIVNGVDGVAGMLDGIGFPAATAFAWILIIGEIGSGIAILAKWKLDTVMYIPIIILLVASFTVHWGNWTNFVMHLAVASNYWIFGLTTKSNYK